MPAHLARGAAVGRVVVVLLLAHPRGHRVARGGARAAAPVQILPVLPPRVLQRQAAPRLALRVRARVRLQAGVPRQRPHAHLAPRRVLGRQILIRLRMSKSHHTSISSHHHRRQNHETSEPPHRNNWSLARREWSEDRNRSEVLINPKVEFRLQNFRYVS
jgi:hypothetical protein